MPVDSSSWSVERRQSAPRSWNIRLETT